MDEDKPKPKSGVKWADITDDDPWVVSDKNGIKIPYVPPKIKKPPPKK